MIPNILIVYGTENGQTERIVRRIGLQLAGAGIRSDIYRADRVPASIRLEGFDGFIVGASVRFGRHQRYVRRFVRRNAHWLCAVPSLFVSVSGSAAGTSADDAAKVQGYMERFLHGTGWKPSMVKPVAGAVAWSQYGPLIRWMLRRKVKHDGGNLAEFEVDRELTDWHAVEMTAANFAQALLSQHRLKEMPSSLVRETAGLPA